MGNVRLEDDVKVHKYVLSPLANRVLTAPQDAGPGTGPDGSALRSIMTCSGAVDVMDDEVGCGF